MSTQSNTAANHQPCGWKHRRHRATKKSATALVGVVVITKTVSPSTGRSYFKPMTPKQFPRLKCYTIKRAPHRCFLRVFWYKRPIKKATTRRQEDIDIFFLTCHRKVSGQYASNNQTRRMPKTPQFKTSRILLDTERINLLSTSIFLSLVGWHTRTILKEVLFPDKKYSLQFMCGVSSFGLILCLF